MFLLSELVCTHDKLSIYAKKFRVIGTLKKSGFAEDVLFYPWNEVMAFPKIEMK